MADASWSGERLPSRSTLVTPSRVAGFLRLKHHGPIRQARDEMAAEDQVREQLIAFIDGHDAHLPFDAAVREFPAAAINRPAPNLPYTPWHLLEHIRTAQRDILDYIRDRAYLAPAWPDEYWPARHATATPEELSRTIDAFRLDREALRALVADPAVDLLAPIPGTPGHTILREIRILGAHNAYHVGEFAILRQVMGTWPPGRDQDG